MLPPIILIGIIAVAAHHLFKKEAKDEPVSKDGYSGRGRDGGREPRSADQVDCRVTELPAVVLDDPKIDPVISPEN